MMAPRGHLRDAAALPGTPVTLDAAQCVHSRDRFASCDLCVRACPVGALQLKEAVLLDSQACVGCGACLHLCPTGALESKDGSHDLLTVGSRLKGVRHIELVCAHHPSPARGPLSEAALQTSGCLAVLGPSVYVSLATLSFQHISVRLDACGACPLGKVKTQIERTIEAARELLSPEDTNSPIEVVTGAGDGWGKRPVYDSATVPLSRRELFRLFRTDGP